MTSPARALDLAPLDEHVGRWDAAYLADQVRARPAYAHWHLGRAGSAWAAVGLVVLLVAEAVLLWVYTTGAWMPVQSLLFWAGIALVLITYVSLAVTVVQGVRAPHRARALARVIRFANRNDLVFEPIGPNRDFPGERFAGLYLRDRVAAPDGAFEYGQRLLPGRHGAYGGTALGWYLALPLAEPVPPATLTVRGRTPLGNGEPVALEGEGGTRFMLRCAPGAEHAARRIFTPEALALLSDGRASCDAEIAGAWLLVYPHRSTALRAYGDTAFHRRLLRIVEALGSAGPVRPPGIEVGPGDPGRLRERWPARLVMPGLLVAVLAPAALVAVVLALV